MHKHVAAFLHPLAVSEGSDEPKPRLVVEPLHAASEPGSLSDAAAAAAAADVAATVGTVGTVGTVAVYWAAAVVVAVYWAVVALVGCTHCCFRSDKNPRRVFKFVFGISCFIV